ncbi:hypothetical protein N9Q68_00645 [Polaribacter sp.]|nr:hypothetical protein [Polaribacter sp.]
MNHLFYRRVVVIMVLIFCMQTTTAQYKRSNLSFEIGINTVDVRVYTTDMKTLLKDYFGTTEWSGNTTFSPSRIAVQKYLGNKITLQLAGSINTIKTTVELNDSDYNYYSLDLILKRDLTQLFESGKWFDPYVLGGVGTQTIDTASDAVFIGGFGFNVWFGTRYGVNFQTSYKHGLNSDGRDVFQHSISFIYDFSFFSLDSRKRVWNNYF